MLKRKTALPIGKSPFPLYVSDFGVFFLFHEVVIFRFYPRNLFFLFSKAYFKAISTLEILCHPIIIRNNLKKYMPRQAPIITQQAVVAIVKEKFLKKCYLLKSLRFLCNSTTRVFVPLEKLFRFVTHEPVFYFLNFFYLFCLGNSSSNICQKRLPSAGTASSALFIDSFRNCRVK